MKESQQTKQQVERAIEKIIAKFPQHEDSVVFTDIHLRVIQESGEIRAYDDDEKEITRCVIDDWINNTNPQFYNHVASLLRQLLNSRRDKIELMGIAQPFSFVLEDDEHEAISELYIADDDTIIIGGDLMENLDKDLDAFFENLMKE